TAHAGSIERSTEEILPSSSGPTTTRSYAACPFDSHKSLLNTVIRGDCRSACQQAESKRANSASSVRIKRLAGRKGVKLPRFPSPPEKVSHFHFFHFVHPRNT